MKRGWKLGAAAGAAIAAVGAVYFIWVHEPDYGGEPGVPEAAAWLATLGPAKGLPLTPSNVGRVLYVELYSGNGRDPGVSLYKTGLGINTGAGRYPLKTVAPLRHLPRIKEIDIDDVETVRGDEAAATFGDLSRLEVLRWYGANELTDAGMAHIGRLTALRRLILRSDREKDARHLGGLKHLGGMTGLRDLWLGGFDADDGLEAVARLPKLSVLRLNWGTARAEGLRHLGAMKALVSLNLVGTKIEGSLTPIARLPALTSLDLSSSTADDAQVASLSGAPEIESLYANKLTIGTKGLAAFGSMPKLKTLELEYAKVEGDLGALATAPVLDVLGLENAIFEDGNAAAIGKIKSLRTLSLMETAAGDKTAAGIADLPLLTSVNLNQTKITDEGLRHLGRVAKLETLTLNETQIGDEGVAHLAKAPALKRLVLYKTRITDAGLRHLRGIKTLSDIYVGQTAVTDAGIAALKEALPGLTVNK